MCGMLQQVGPGWCPDCWLPTPVGSLCPPPPPSVLYACLQDDIDTLCAGVCNAAAGQPCGGLVLQCLQDKQDNITSQLCQEEVRGALPQQPAASTNAPTARLHQGAQAKPAGTSAACLHPTPSPVLCPPPAACCQVFYYELMEVNDFRNDVILAEACRGDVEKYCKDTQPGARR